MAARNILQEYCDFRLLKLCPSKRWTSYWIHIKTSNKLILTVKTLAKQTTVFKITYVKTIKDKSSIQSSLTIYNLNSWEHIFVQQPLYPREYEGPAEAHLHNIK
jgi:hypothetical protein